MKRLETLKKELGSSVLNKQEIINTKGGLRYETRNYVEFVSKLTNLGGQGKCVCWGYHNGTYCIEW